MLKRILTTSILLPVFITAFSQTIQFRDPITGRPYLLLKEEGVEGSIFLFEGWKTGKVMLANKKVYDNLQLRFDVYHNQFYYNHNDSLYVFMDAIEEIRIPDPMHSSEQENDMVFRRDVSVDNPLGKFIQVLSTGKIRLAKSYSKVIEESVDNSTSYGIGTKTAPKIRTLVLKTSQWAVKDNNIIQIKFTASALKDLTGDKRAEMEAFISSKRLNLKKESDFIAAVNFYNQISK